jgi:hypothetical protein
LAIIIASHFNFTCKKKMNVLTPAAFEHPQSAPNSQPKISKWGGVLWMCRSSSLSIQSVPLALRARSDHVLSLFNARKKREQLFFKHSLKGDEGKVVGSARKQRSAASA